ncbi:MAG TPA: alpha/beta hydrolase [Sphingomicrobium sp.]|nr:alpha/beta hydrolase [Sphingomicrobium sp.]
MTRMPIALIATIAAAAFALHAPAHAESVKVNGIELHYDVQGSGEPLIMLHGFGECSRMWAPVVPELAKAHRVITVDMRGHGRSTNPSNKFSHPQSAEDIRALMDSLGIKQARAIGFSSGGMTLLRLATKYPDRLTKMVVVGATTHFGDQARAMVRSVSMETLPPPILDGFRKCATRGDTQVREILAQFAHFADTTDDMNLTPADLAKVKAQTLIVHGDRDEFFPVAIPVTMYGSIPKAALWIVPGGDHSPSAGADREEFVEVVSEFLAKP